MLLSHGADANAADSYGQTSLHYAAYSGRLNIMRLLLEAGAVPNVAHTKSGETPLMYAAWVGEEAMVQMLLSHGADANATDSYGWTSLHIAVCSGRLDIVRLLLEAGADPSVADTESGMTPLMMAVRKGNEAAVQMLLSHGADPNAADSQGQTSLYYAATSVYFEASSGRLNIMRLLLEAGADPNAADTKSGRTPLMRAVVQMLLSHGADANAASLQGQTSLYYAATSGYDRASSGRLNIMRLLLEAGAVPNVAHTKSGETPLMCAARMGVEAVVQMLLSHGADANAADSHGQSLYHAACSGRLDIVRLLLEAGADPNIADTESGETPLMMAVSKCEEATVQMLLSHGADANAANSNGETSLHYAAYFCRLDIVRLLLEAGADPNVAATEEMKSFTALHYSCDRLKTEMITLLLKHGADPNLVDCNKRTPLAIIGNQAEVRSTRMSERGAHAAPAEQAESVVQAASALLQTFESAGVLLQVNTRDSEGDTPLHSFCRAMLACKDDVYARQREGCVQIVHALLFNHGAHVDMVNARGETPYELWRRINPTRFRGNVESSDEIHGRMSAQYHSLKCHCARVIVTHSVAYENTLQLPLSLIEFVRAHARPM
ncbi:PREDICTED: putative ankyrin repeat protein RF_0381 [Priapulus caudatus]|uniref:Ankyrin repeat protein RF_0381 n=1 Tax=Priapulus caudatus TaxID=37621 RepID=A0ABM1DT70_PRICU|nr:PREDICTED: putative ankyrin repeat protein RF_0381 [Priapulus caudatus]